MTSQNGSLTALTQAPSFWHAARHTRRPMRPKPEIPRLADIFESLVVCGGRRAIGEWEIVG